MTNKSVSKEEIAAREKQFQDALAEYRATGSKAAWDCMYFRVADAVHNIAAKKLVGVKLDPEVFEDRCADATLYIMKRIRQGLDPGKLSSYVYLCVIGRFYSEKAKFEDRNIMYVDNIFQTIEKQQQEELE